MTSKEAIRVLEDNRPSVIFEDKDAQKRMAELCKAIDMAIEALNGRPQGEWKHTITWQPYCSNCEYVFGEDEEFSPFWKYCPMCGARMKGGAE